MTAMPANARVVTLSRLLAGIRAVPAPWDRPVRDLAADSRELRAGACFLALRGSRCDALQFLDAAIGAGAVAVLAESPSGADRIRRDVPVLHVPRLREHASAIAGRFFAEPSAALRLVGVTGTNGKTTVSQLLAQALDGWPALAPCAVIGTLGYGRPGALVPTVTTTPEAVQLQRILAQVRDRGGRAAVLEVSSHALTQGRVAALVFDVAVFTNLSRDHLDYHADMEAYAAAKAQLFTHPGLAHAVINLDDPYGRALAARLPAGVKAIGFSLEASVTGAPTPEVVHASAVTASAEGLDLRVQTAAGAVRLRSPLLGRVNAANLLAALAALLALGLTPDAAAAALARARAVPGRLERLGGDGRPLVLVDYAHTPAALEQALGTARTLAPGRLWCVFGCGGERDPGKRAQMGALAAALADEVILTSDNPRHEDPQRILEAIAAGMDGRTAAREPDRARAIRAAVAGAGPDDVVLIAGKGHEDYQQLGDRRVPFSDRAVAAAALAERRP